MAVLTDGPNGPIKGKFGSVFAYQLNGQTIVRGARRPRTKPPTEAELINREKTKITNTFLRTLFPIIRYGYKNLLADHPTKNTANLAQSHVRKECILIDANKEPYVDPALFKPFRGSLNVPQNPHMQLENEQLHIFWDKEQRDSFVKMNIMLLQVDENADFKIAVADATKGSCAITSNVLKTKGETHLYIGFVDTYKDILSDSVYLGVIQAP